MLTERHTDRLDAIVRLLRGQVVRRQSELARLLRSAGFAVTQSSVSRDLRELGVLKASGRYLPPPDEVARANGDFTSLARFVRGISPAGPAITVIRTSIGAAGTIAGDDTIFIATPDARAQTRLVERLHTLFRI